MAASLQLKPNQATDLKNCVSFCSQLTDKSLIYEWLTPEQKYANGVLLHIRAPGKESKYYLMGLLFTYTERWRLIKKTEKKKNDRYASF